MWIVAIATFHYAFENFMVKRFVEVWLYLAVAAYAKLGLTCLQHVKSRKAWFLCVGWPNKGDRPRNILVGSDKVRRVTISTPDVVAPMLAAAEVVVLFFSCVAGQTGFRSFFGRFVFERNDLRRIAFFRVGLAWPVTGFATRYFAFPTAYPG